MGQIIKTEPAYCTKPGTAVTENGLIVSAVFRGQEPCGLILYNKKDGRKFTVPFTDEHRFGSLYSVRISPLDPDEWCYRLYSGSTFFVDPCCRSLVKVSTQEGIISAGGFFYKPDDKLPVFKKNFHRRGGETIIYSLHVRGFTMLDKGLTSCPGTFSAAAEKLRRVATEI